MLWFCLQEILDEKRKNQCGAHVVLMVSSAMMLSFALVATAETAQECFDANCKKKATLSACYACCTAKCINVATGCQDLCDDKFYPVDPPAGP